VRSRGHVERCRDRDDVQPSDVEQTSSLSDFVVTPPPVVAAVLRSTRWNGDRREPRSASERGYTNTLASSVDDDDDDDDDERMNFNVA